MFVNTTSISNVRTKSRAKTNMYLICKFYIYIFLKGGTIFESTEVNISMKSYMTDKLSDFSVYISYIHPWDINQKGGKERFD